MQKYTTVCNEIVIAEEVDASTEYTGIIIVQDKNGNRHVVKRKKQKMPKERKSLRISRKVRVTDPEGNTTTYETVRQAAEALNTNRGDIDKYSRVPAKAGRWLGWEFQKLGGS